MEPQIHGSWRAVPSPHLKTPFKEDMSCAKDCKPCRKGRCLVNLQPFYAPRHWADLHDPGRSRHKHKSDSSLSADCELHESMQVRACLCLLEAPKRSLRVVGRQAVFPSLRETAPQENQEGGGCYFSFKTPGKASSRSLC